LADAPREWFLRLDRCLKEKKWCPLALDAATWVLRRAGEIVGMIVGHVDDLLFTGDEGAWASFLAISRELGFGSLEEDDFVWCGKRIRRDELGRVCISMEQYHENLQPVFVDKRSRLTPDAPLEKGLLRAFRGACGSLQWLVAQLRVDLAYRVSTLQAELKAPTVSSVLKANELIAECRRTSDFKLVYDEMDWKTGVLVGISDAALGNVDEIGKCDGGIEEKVFSQAGYLIFFAEKQLLEGRPGRMVLWDWRSHRLKRVGNSSFVVETYGLDECVDAGQLIRGFLSELRGWNLLDKPNLEQALETVPFMLVTDAKDSYDKVVSDKNTLGTRRSLALTLAWLKQQFRGKNILCRWTDTSNMLADPLTKNMDPAHLVKMLNRGTWSVTYNQDFIKTKLRARPAGGERPRSRDDLPGLAVTIEEERFLEGQSGQVGWSQPQPGRVMQLAKEARSMRTPEPRFVSSKFPLRSSFGLFELADGDLAWRRLERRVPFLDLKNQHAMLKPAPMVLLSIFDAAST